MNFLKLSNAEFHKYAESRAGAYTSIEAEMVEIMIDVERRKLYLEFGLRSSFQYATVKLKLSESVTYALKAVSRKATEIPEFRKAIQDEKISLSKGKAMTAALTKENGAAFVKKSFTMTLKEVEKEVARLSPKSAKPEKLKYISESELELQTTLSEEMAEQLKRIQDLESQRTGKACDRRGALKAAFEVYLQHKDPVKKAERATKKPRAAKQDSVGKIPSARKGNRRIPAAVTHAVNLRDQHQCTHVHEDGTRCDSRRWIEHHHIVPIWVGGEHTPENMRTLCSVHHRSEHKPYG